ncbi:response regulator [Terasakiella sp. A23]|uniref:response regulator transcription factor n=1 Tax=Terasakiella sp. FCG-A23 TaxID=3080561 RepID=UPI002955B8B6|nr:response regulator [Terasakiella sp. A23]MDV7339251.1 response regulator [Terasakiella sp. A23]
MIKPRLLIVEDTQVVRMVIAKTVEEMGAKVVGLASDGIEAEEKFQEHKPDLTLMDIKMPNRDGIEALKILLKKKPDAKIVMLTAIGDIETAEKCIEIGATGYLYKDFNSDDFIDGLKMHLETA